MTMTSDAKRALSKTIRGLRETLLTDLHESTESAYRLSLKAKDAVLSEASRVGRERLEAWVSEQVRALPKKQQKGADARFLREVEKDAAAALLQRLVYLRLLEASGLRSPKVVMGGWESPGYKDFRQLAPELVRDDETEGYAALLRLVFDELAGDLPGLFGDVRLTSLVPVPAKTLRAVVEALDNAELESCWTDDMTLGWIYQYWNDPEREAIDAKMNDGGKVENHEIASKTQMFTERYMVDWLLQNSLGPMWLAMCKKHGWTPEVEADGTLAGLEERRVAFRAKREAGEVELTELMPLHSDAERRWAYYVPQPIPEDAVAQANESVRELKILDPAVGSGHFLVVAFDLLVALYREEARHRGEEGQPQWGDKAIVESILERNLHGIDLDPHAVQIAAAALLLKAKLTCADAHPGQVNLVASKLGLSSLPADDPSRISLRETLERETGIPAQLTGRLLDALAGADHLGSLLKIDAAVDEALADCEALLTRPGRGQGELFSDGWKDRRTTIDVEEAKSTLLSRLEVFLHAHSRGDDLGLKLRGEQLAAGVRFVRIAKEGQYALVVGNPPYLGTSKLRHSAEYKRDYPSATADHFAGFFLRAFDYLAPSGLCAFITLNNWMFLKAYAAFRELVYQQDLVALADLGKAAFSSGGTLISTSCTVFRRMPSSGSSVALRSFQDYELRRDDLQPMRTNVALTCHVGRHDFDPTSLKVVPEWPLIYWWDSHTLDLFRGGQTIGALSPARKGLDTGNNSRFVRNVWELRPAQPEFAAFVQGGKGQTWIEPHRYSVRWAMDGVQIRIAADTSSGANVRNASFYFQRGVAFSLIGSGFTARVHHCPSVIAGKGSSVFPEDLAQVVCMLNSTRARQILESLNPGIGFEVGDVNRLPLLPIRGADAIFAEIEHSFCQHEAHRETSVEFKLPGASSWLSTCTWAQLAIDSNEELGAKVKTVVTEPPSDHLSFALGVALGRFGASGGGIIDASKDDLSATLPVGICFLNATLDPHSTDDSLGHIATEFLHDKWKEHGPAIDAKTDLRTWLRLTFFKDVHKGMYENRPIYFPLSSEKKTFVAFISIHRWDETTLRALLAEHLHPALLRLEGELPDLRAARDSADKKAARNAEDRYGKVTAWKTELTDFIANVEQCAEKGPPAPDNKTPEREVDARYALDLDDGVMINSAALWPLLLPQWKDPKKWWKELATSKGKKDYDWAHLAARYFPTRVDAKCQQDPSLGVAHGCFWKYHPAVAYKWELRLQDEIAPDFTIDEQDSDTHRQTFETEHSEKVQELIAKEQKRRDTKRKKQQKLDFDK
tara:strand:- start:12793 stop:16701 length:3909 start_codon:yes stop_codon:yes gene_type:complete